MSDIFETIRAPAAGLWPGRSLGMGKRRFTEDFGFSASQGRVAVNPYSCDGPRARKGWMNA
jgi:hypothetical protein